MVGWSIFHQQDYIDFNGHGPSSSSAPWKCSNKQEKSGDLFNFLWCQCCDMAPPHAIEISALKAFCWVLRQVCCGVPFHSICGKAQKPTKTHKPKITKRKKKKKKMPSIILVYYSDGSHLPQPIALAAVRRLAPAAIGWREGNNITKFLKKQYKIPPALQALQRSSLPCPCANYELYQHDVRLPHSAALPTPLPHTFTPNPPSNFSSIALIRGSLHFCRLWETNLVSGC